MSELSSQAYDSVTENSRHSTHVTRHFHFPPVGAGANHLAGNRARSRRWRNRADPHFDLANVFSVAAIQTEDLGIRRGEGFELIGRAQIAEPRGCSL